MTNAELRRWVYNGAHAQSSGNFRLFCFPYAGAGASVFRDWQKELPSTAEVVPVQLPGREGRWSDQPIQDLPLLAATMVTALEPMLIEPYALFGHSMGALIAFEWSKHLRRLNGTEPVHLFVAAQHAPQLPSPYPPADSISDPAARETLRALWGSPRLASADDQVLDRLFKRVEPCLVLQQKGYRFEHEAPLGCPVTALYGTADPVLQPSHLEAWQTHTRGSFEMINVDGGHLFVRDQADLVASLLAERLAERKAA
jgi:medium-chain acyl-[acyl-carrier-protein] hydrolase